MHASFFRDGVYVDAAIYAAAAGGALRNVSRIS
jgi:hypothetical protein